MTAPSNKKQIDELVLRLGALAFRWRGYCSDGKEDKAACTVEDYRKVVKNLKRLGWTGDDLLPDEEIPTVDNFVILFKQTAKRS